MSELTGTTFWREEQLYASLEIYVGRENLFTSHESLLRKVIWISILSFLRVPQDIIQAYSMYEYVMNTYFLIVL